MVSSKKSAEKGVKGRKAVKPKREKFVENYLSNGGNATKAAEEAGYSPRTARQQGSRLLLTNVDIQQRIKARMADAQVQTNEVIGTLASHMRADIADVVPENPIARAAREAGVSHLIRKLIIKRYWDKSKEAEVEETTVEMHNSQAAAKQLCSVFGLNKEAATNPHDAARAAYEDLMSRYSLKPEEAAPIVSEQFGLPENEFVN